MGAMKATVAPVDGAAVAAVAAVAAAAHSRSTMFNRMAQATGKDSEIAVALSHKLLE